jgi:hypothetical protein
MVIVASIYLRFYIEVGVGTFLPTPTPPKIPSDSDSTALHETFGVYLRQGCWVGVGVGVVESERILSVVGRNFFRRSR